MSRWNLCCTALFLFAGTAAATTDCPPGDWFCGPVPSAPPPSEPKAPEASPPMDPGAEQLAIEPKYPPMDLSIPPPRPLPRRVRAKVWAVRTQFLLPIVDSGAASNYLMGGLGFGGRARPDEALALDLSFDALSGVDYVGHRRTEMALNFATSVFFNPHDPIQAFMLAGLGWSRADVSYNVQPSTAPGTIQRPIDQTYYYFGLFAGLGVEWRFEPRWSLDFALLGILRSRTDSEADRNPEFVDPKTKLATNSSGMGLLRLGLNFYF